MARTSSLRDAVARVNEWAQWVLRLERSGLGYPDHAPIAEINSGGKRPASSIVPNLVFNSRAAEVDNAIKAMETSLAVLIRHKHLSQRATDLELAHVFCEKYDISISTYYRWEKDAYMWLSGWLSREQGKSSK